MAGRKLMLHVLRGVDSGRHEYGTEGRLSEFVSIDPVSVSGYQATLPQGLGYGHGATHTN